MQVKFVAGFGPIVKDRLASLQFYAGALGLPLPDEEYSHTEELDGVKAFALWKLEDAAQSCFGTNEWPADLPVPQVWLEFDVETEAGVESAARELQSRGLRVLAGPKKEEWGQTVLRLQSPEGLLVGVTYSPWMHEDR